MKKLLVVFLFLIGIAGLFVYYLLFIPNVKREGIITIEKEIQIDSLASELRPYLKSGRTFLITAKIKRFHSARPGKFLIKKDLSNNDLINLLRSGQQVEINVTFNNIRSLGDLAGKISKKIIADSVSLLRAFSDRDFLEKNGFTQETALLMYIPNTYRFYYTTDAKGFRSRMLKEYKKFWNPDRMKAAKELGLSPVEVGILASIVKKESVKSSEKPTIAGVYLNRLRKGMKLEADPTAVFAYKLVTGDTTTIRRVLNKHISIDNPYNTYQYAGLPPGPIAMPDPEDIDAVLHAEEHDYLFFSADPKRPGYHLFSKTFSEHLKKAQAYRSHLNKRRVFK